MDDRSHRYTPSDADPAERFGDDIAEFEAAHAARLRISQQMTMSERLARTHELCAQLSTLRPIERRQH